MARKDMTETAFKAAVDRRGFRLAPYGYGIEVSDTRTCGFLLKWIPSKKEYGIDFRRSLSRAIAFANES